MKDKLLRFPAVREAVGLSRSSIWRMEQKRLFPRRRRLGAHSVAWLSSEIADWVASRQRVTTANREK